MKYINTLFIALLVLSIFLSMSVTVFASGTGKITISPAENNQTYTIYRLLDLESYDANAGAYSYKVSAKWSTFFNSANNTGALNYVDIDSNGYVTWRADKNTAADYAAFAKLANAYAVANLITNDGQKKADSAVVEFSSLPLGYYLVDTTLGSLCALNTTNPNATICEKNTAPTILKQINDGGSLTGTSDGNMGDIVQFQTKITANAGAENYVMHDIMEAGLQWQGTVAVTLNGTAVSSSNYSLRTQETTPAACSDCTFDVVFNNDFCSTLNKGDVITVSYSAKILQSAVVGNPGNKNTAWLCYGNDNETTKSITTTYTWKIKVFKYAEEIDGETTTQVPLSGAVFELRKGDNPIKFVKDTDVDNLYKVCTETTCTHTHLTQITTDSTGRFTIEGLASGTYSLVEIEAPAGYNKLNEPIIVSIDSSGAINASESSNGVSEILVLNQTGAELPDTGDCGTTWFYVLGSLILISGTTAAILLFHRKEKKIN